MWRGAQVALSIMSVALLVGCAGSGTNPQSSAIAISALMKDLGLGTQVTRVQLQVTGDGFEPITADGALAHGEVRFEVEVPFGENRIVQLSAFNSASVLLYRGADTVDVISGQVTEVTVNMLPQVAMVKVTPLFREINSAQNAVFAVNVFNVDSLFGVSFRVDFDSLLLSVVDADPGNVFAGQSPLFLRVQRSGYVALAISLKGNQQPQGISVDGSLATFEVQPLGVGTSALTINPETIELIDWQGNSLPHSESLYIENGEVQIVAP